MATEYERPPFSPRSLDDWDSQLTERPRWLIDGMVARSTLLVGQPHFGKSSLALAMADAITKGDSTFFGRNIATGPVGVTIAVTDQDALSETHSRAKALGMNTKAILLDKMPRLRENESVFEVFSQIGDALVANGSKLFILDNATGVVPGTVNNDQNVQSLFDGLKVLVDEFDVFTLIIHHATTKLQQNANGTAYTRRDPVGSYVFSAVPRLTLTVENKGPTLRQLTIHGNTVSTTNLGFDLRERNGVPEVVWVPDYQGPKAKESRSLERLEQDVELRALAAESPEQGDLPTARWLIENKSDHPLIAPYAARARVDQRKATESLRKRLGRAATKDKAA